MITKILPFYIVTLHDDVSIRKVTLRIYWSTLNVLKVKFFSPGLYGVHFNQYQLELKHYVFHISYRKPIKRYSSKLEILKCLPSVYSEIGK